jgi:hypothetical protein
MAKCMILNALGEKMVRHYVPMSAVNANTFATDVLDGTWKIFEETSAEGSDSAVVSAKAVAVQLVNETNQTKTYLRFIAKSTQDTDSIRAALTGLTVNGVLVEKVVFISVEHLTFA